MRARMRWVWIAVDCAAAGGVFRGGAGDLQGMIPRNKVPFDFKVTGGVLFVAPPFRHTHFAGKQVVVHDRTATHQEILRTTCIRAEREEGRLLDAAG